MCLRANDFCPPRTSCGRAALPSASRLMHFKRSNCVTSLQGLTSLALRRALAHCQHSLSLRSFHCGALGSFRTVLWPQIPKLQRRLSSDLPIKRCARPRPLGEQIARRSSESQSVPQLAAGRELPTSVVSISHAGAARSQQGFARSLLPPLRLVPADGGSARSACKWAPLVVQRWG